jgi:hypothetical protein
MENLKNILRDAIAVAKETGLWQKFTLKEKESIVRYFYSFGNMFKDKVVI